MQTVNRWGTLELSFHGKTEGNPFTDYSITGTFTGANEQITVDGFYDGMGIYKIRFMPSFTGSYTYEINGSFAEEAQSGQFEVTEPEEGNHGMVHVANTYHFAYSDGTPYYSIGTTCYVWDLQSDEQIQETLESLKKSAFNKIRFCIFPKHYDYNLGEPRSYPYEGTPMNSSVLTKDNFLQYTGKTQGNHFDFTRFNPKHFQNIDRCILALRDLGIEADLIVMHPYDRWGFSQMTHEEDMLYWRYVLARFSAYRNVWWSLANEYDLMEHKTLKDWESYADLICKKDPYHHLRSIHNCRRMYDYSRPWVTHCSVQRTDLYKTAEMGDELRERFQKPVVFDEIAYEGNIQHGWGNITPEEMVRRFWEAACRGCYPGHSETYMNPKDILWWSHGGKLHGESWKRFALLRDVMKQTPGLGLKLQKDGEWDSVTAVPEAEPDELKTHSYYLHYYSFMRPSFRDYYVDDTTEYRVKVIDTWNMTIQDLGVHKGKIHIDLPGRPYMAVQMIRNN